MPGTRTDLPARPAARVEGRTRPGSKGPDRTRGHLGRGVFAALLLHAHVLIPLGVATLILAARERAERADEVDLGFENVSPEELPRELPPLDDTPPPAKVRDRFKPDRTLAEDRRPDKKKRPDQPKPLAKEREKPEQTEPEVVVPPLPPMPEPPPQQPKAHEKMVDLDNDKEVEPPPNAKYLAQKNNRAEVETRATQTNLDREQKGDEGSQQPQNERRDDKEVGDDRAKIAQLEDLKSKLGKKAPDVTPRKEAEAAESPNAQPAPRPSPVLTLRDTASRGHELTPETLDPSLPHDPAGLLARPKPRGTFKDEESNQPHRGDKRLKLALSGKDYEYLFGKEAQADRQLAERERSSRLGKFARRTARVRSALENFIPEVQPGNQTALNTRAAPFAAFIARMHRNIHQLWGFGQLEDWDELPSSSPFNDESLMNVLEIVLNRDGTVDKVTVVRSSRYLPYDAAAIDVVYSAAPYPEPPREIRSANGKIYVHWSFFRDGRQCATSGVDYFILNNAPKGGDTGGAELRPPPPPEPAQGPRRLQRNLGPAGAPGRRAMVEPSERGERGQRSVDGTPDGEGGEEGGARTRSAESARDDEATATTLARGWFAAYVKGDVDAMTGRAAFPFRSTSGVVAKDRDELARMLRALVAETSKRSVSSVTVESAAGLRKLVGKLPPGLDDGSGMRFAITQSDGDTLILLLSRTPRGWKVVGLVRR